MKRILFALLACAAMGAAHADDGQACSAAGGSYLTGTIEQGPKFAHGQFRSGVELSHTHLKVRADQDGRLYDKGVGIHFVHTNCGQSPTASHPDGFIRVVDAQGKAGPNLEANPSECRLFGPAGKRRRH